MIDKEAECGHARVEAAVCDQTLAVVCADCDMHLAACWRDEHIPESLWNRACENDPSCKPCEQGRDDVCAICKANMGAE